MSQAVHHRRAATYAKRQTAREKVAAARAQNRRTHRRHLVWAVTLLAIAAVVAGMLLTSRPTQRTETGTAPAFTLTNTAGQKVSLADYRGKPVLLYFNEGAGCDACFYQMVDIEKHAAEFTKLGVTVLPIAANPAGQLRPELARFSLKTPWLTDTDVSVSKAYGTVGRGMHAGLPGHGFVLVDGTGTKRWYGEYPTMFLPADKLLAQIRDKLS